MSSKTKKTVADVAEEVINLDTKIQTMERALTGLVSKHEENQTDMVSRIEESKYDCISGSPIYATKSQCNISGCDFFYVFFGS